MTSSKKLKTIIIVLIGILVLIVLAAIGFVLLKKTGNNNSKEMFFKYISQKNIKQFTKIDGYNDILSKVNENPYTFEGNIDVKTI